MARFDLPKQKRRLPTYPRDHEPFMKVTKGGSSCANCKFSDDAVGRPTCSSPHYRAFFGSDQLPIAPLDAMCSDWWEPRQ